MTKKYRLYAACRYFSYFGTVKDPYSNLYGIHNNAELLKNKVCASFLKELHHSIDCEVALGYINLFLTVAGTINRCNPSIYAGYSDLGFRNEIW